MFENFKANMARKNIAKVDAKRDAGLSIPSGVELHEGIAYGSHAMQTLDVSLPKDVKNPPLIVNVHGGGYFYGSTLPYRFYCADLARRGFAVVSFNYRLAPEFKFPTPLYDLNAVMEWCLGPGKKYGYDTDNIFMVGDSAGAQIASQYAAICTNPEYAEIMEIQPPKGLTFRALGLNCGMYDLPPILKTMGTEPGDVFPWYFGKDGSALGKKADVLRYITADYPPCYLVSSPGDFLMKLCEPMANFLKKQGVEAKFKIYGGDKTPHVFHVNLRNSAGRMANDDEMAFFRRHLVGREEE